MAEQFLEDIYKNSRILDELQKIIDYTRVADTANANIILKKIYDDLKNLCEAYVADLPEKSQPFLKNIQAMLNTKDPIFMADIIESDILPDISSWISNIAAIDVDINDQYQIKSSKSGFLTIYDKINDKYLHSINNPMTEARRYVKELFNTEVDNYAIYGGGLGYYAYQLYLESYGSVNITIYEPNPLMIDLAKNYGVLDWIPSENLNIVCDDDILTFLNGIDNDDTGIIFHLPTLENIEEQYELEALKSILITQNTERFLRLHRHINFWRNAHKNIPCASTIDKSSLKKKFAVVAAGPSLDLDVELLRFFSKEMTVIAVGTIFRRLVKENIIPDFVSIMDPWPQTADQIRGLEFQNVPLVMDSITAWEVAKIYQGPKYMIYTVSDIDSRQYEYAKQFPSSAWKRSGGTVSSCALELALQLGAEEVYFFGLDLAYPKGKSHAEGTLAVHTESTENMTEIDGVLGQKVFADTSFLYYIKNIEEQIASKPDVTYYNMSELGARIKGTIEWKANK